VTCDILLTCDPASYLAPVREVSILVGALLLAENDARRGVVRGIVALALG
jgi:hypothetical protein